MCEVEWRCVKWNEHVRWDGEMSKKEKLQQIRKDWKKKSNWKIFKKFTCATVFPRIQDKLKTKKISKVEEDINLQTEGTTHAGEKNHIVW